MSYDRDDYLMLGVDVGASCFDWARHENEVNGTPDARFSVIYDGMSGQYCIAGIIIAKSDPYEGFEMAKVSEEKLGVDRVALAALIAEAFDRPDIGSESISLILFTHFS